MLATGGGTADRYLGPRGRCHGVTVLGGSSQDSDTWLITIGSTPWKINGWNMSSWRFGRSFSFLFMVDGCRFQPFIFQDS